MSFANYSSYGSNPLLEYIPERMRTQVPAGVLTIVIPIIVTFVLILLLAVFWAAVYIFAPLPRPPFASETTYRTVSSDGQSSQLKRLACWQDKWLAKQGEKPDEKTPDKNEDEVEAAEVFMSVVVPAYNEQDRLSIMLEEAVEYLESEYTSFKDMDVIGVRKRKATPGQASGSANSSNVGWEVLIISDGSTDKTVEVALDFAAKHPDGSIRVITLKQNRGKGGAVIHGMRHVRGQYVAFADADGASKFADLGKLVKACGEAKDKKGRAVAVGSRAHLVGSEAVVKRSKLRNFLMHSFHLLLRLLTPPATSRIKDTQCGFKLFSRATLPYIVPHMHSEGWIFDVEMLMLAERAHIPMVEVPIGWHEVKGSKLNVLWDSLGMAWGLTILRLAYTLGVYKAV